MDTDAFPFNNSSVPRDHVIKTDIPVWTQYIQLAYMIAIFLIGIPGNGLVAAIQTKLPNKSSTDCFVLALAIVDLFSSSLVTAFYMAQNIPLVWKIVKTNIFCKLKYFLIFGSTVSSTILFSAVAFDRYMRTCRPLSSTYTHKKAKLFCTGSITLSFLIALATFRVFKLKEDGTMCCIDKNFHIHAKVMLSFLTAAFVLLFTSVVVCYTKVTIELRKGNKGTNRLKTEAVKKGEKSAKIYSLFKSRKIVPSSCRIDKITIEGDETVKCKTSGPASKLKTAEENDIFPSYRYACQIFGNKKCNFAGYDSKNLNNLDASSSSNGVPRGQKTARPGELLLSFPLTSRSDEAGSLKDTPMVPQVNSSKGSGNSGKTVKFCFEDEVRFYNTEIDRNRQKRQEKQKRKTSAKVSIRSPQNVNYITFMLFLITISYIATWLILWLLYAVIDRNTETGSIVVYFSKTSFVLNYVTNPIFYSFMSAKFRKKLKSFFCRVKRNA